MIHSDNSISLQNIVSEFNLEILNGADFIERTFVHEDDINRPGLPLTGFFEHFDTERIQIIGMLETALLARYTSECRRESFKQLFEKKIPAVIVTRNIEPFPECVEMARIFNIPLLRTPTNTSKFLNDLNFFLKISLAPSITVHGTLMEIYGEGVLIQGDSGIGKSETAVELVKRGHRLVADDAVIIKRVIGNALIGSAPEVIRNYVELRGIGIVDMKRAFGVGSVKISEEISMILKFEPWSPEADYNRLSVDTATESEDILGVSVPKFVAPVKSGRNLAVIAEIAAMNNRQRCMGLNAARDLSDKIYKSMINKITDR